MQLPTDRYQKIEGSQIDSTRGCRHSKNESLQLRGIVVSGFQYFRCLQMPRRRDLGLGGIPTTTSRLRSLQGEIEKWQQKSEIQAMARQIGGSQLDNRRDVREDED